jgi:chromosome segregation protein
LSEARRLWQMIDIEAGWEDALEAILRERLSALELDRLDQVTDWVAGGAQPPRRIAAYTPAPARHAPVAQGDALLSKVRMKRDEVSRVVADGLSGVRCRDDLAAALGDRDALAVGEAFVTPAGHLVTSQGVTFFAPDNELHGVIARQRELDELDAAMSGARSRAEEARAQRDAVDTELAAAQQTYHAEGLAVTSQQRRAHDLELELLQLRQAAEAAHKRRTQIEQESGELATRIEEAQVQRAAIDAEIADLQSALHDKLAVRESSRHARNEAEVALARGREKLRAAERNTQEAGFAERRCHDRIAELARRSATLLRSAISSARCSTSCRASARPSTGRRSKPR